MELVIKLNMEGDEGISEDDFHECIDEKFREYVDDGVYEAVGYMEPNFSEKVKIVFDKLFPEKQN